MSFSQCKSGNVALMGALLLPLLLTFVGAGVDMYLRASQRTVLQEFADQLALRGAREFLLGNATPAQIEAVVKAAAESELPKRLGIGDFQFKVSANKDDTSVTVALVQKYGKAFIPAKFSTGADEFQVNSTAGAKGGANVCVIALEDSADRAVETGWSAKLDAKECSILSNSTASAGVYASGSSKMTADVICSAGGKSGSDTNFDPMPTTDCPTFDDPLEKREPPLVGACDHFDLLVGERSLETFTAALSASFAEAAAEHGMSDDDDDDDEADDDYDDGRERHTLDPGVYCGGLDIASNADVTFNPGVYVMKDGPLVVDLNAKISGKGVGFYLTGDKASFLFGPDSKIDLEAPTYGPLAGILFFEDRNAPEGRKHSIYSNDARTLLGTFYLPKGTFSVASMQPVADQSAYTAIVAKRVKLTGSPTLVLNSDYTATNVPVPEGVGPVGGSVVLRD